MRLALVLLVACGSRGIEPTNNASLPEHHDFTVTPQQKGPRLVQPEAFLRAYLEWFGHATPQEVKQTARGWKLFDDWSDYLAALGLPDYKVDFPRSMQSNTMMLATIGRLGEALCIKAAEHDLRANRGATPISDRRIYAFEQQAPTSMDQFASSFDILHRTFLGYPAALAEKGRIPRFFELFQRVASRHTSGGRLTGEQMAWAAVCSALVTHPETGLY